MNDDGQREMRRDGGIAHLTTGNPSLAEMRIPPLQVAEHQGNAVGVEYISHKYELADEDGNVPG